MTREQPRPVSVLIEFEISTGDWPSSGTVRVPVWRWRNRRALPAVGFGGLQRRDGDACLRGAWGAWEKRARWERQEDGAREPASQPGTAAPTPWDGLLPNCAAPGP